MSFGRQFCLAVFAFLPTLAHTATVTLEGDTLVIGGLMTIEDERSFFEPFETHTIRTIRFENCLGGRYGQHEALQKLIERHSLATEAKGVVASSCAMAFMAGFPRHLLADGNRTELAFHAPYDVDTDKLYPELGAKFRNYLIQRSSGLISPEVAAMMISPTDRSAWFRVFLNAAMFDGRPVNTVLCQSADAGVACSVLLNLNAESLGLSTDEPSSGAQVDR